MENKNKTGDVVMIYTNPANETEPEGKAELIKLLNWERDLEFWEVQFIDGFKSPRWIKKKV